MTTDRYTLQRERLAKKYDKLEGLKALYAEWEKNLHPTDPYMRDLKQRIRKTEMQLKNMRHEDRHIWRMVGRPPVLSPRITELPAQRTVPSFSVSFSTTSGPARG